jgi:hypothetical protein
MNIRALAGDVFLPAMKRMGEGGDECSGRQLRRPDAPLPGLKVRRAKRCASTSVAQPRAKIKARSVPVRGTASGGDCKSMNPGYGEGPVLYALAPTYDRGPSTEGRE